MKSSSKSGSRFPLLAAGFKDVVSPFETVARWLVWLAALICVMQNFVLVCLFESITHSFYNPKELFANRCRLVPRRTACSKMRFRPLRQCSADTWRDPFIAICRQLSRRPMMLQLNARDEWEVRLVQSFGPEWCCLWSCRRLSAAIRTCLVQYRRGFMLVYLYYMKYVLYMDRWHLCTVFRAGECLQYHSGVTCATVTREHGRVMVSWRR